MLNGEQVGSPHDPIDREVHSVVRPGFGKEGKPIQLLCNHFIVRFTGQDKVIYHYDVSIRNEDQIVINGKGIGRKVVDRLFQIYSSDLSEKRFAYDGEKGLYTAGLFSRENLEFTVVLEEPFSRFSGDDGSPNDEKQKRSRRMYRAKTFKVEIKFVTEIFLGSIMESVQGSQSHHAPDVLRVLDIIIRQKQSERGFLLVGQSFFNADQGNSFDLPGAISGFRGFYSSFCITQAGPSLNIDVSTTIIVARGSVLDFLIANQNIQNFHQIDWVKAKGVLKNMRVNASHTGMEFRIIGLSELPCNQQMFSLKSRSSGGNGDAINITVYDYFFQHRKIELTWSAYVPCLDVGKPNYPNYLPVELCDLVPLQRYKKTLSYEQKAFLLEKSRQKPMECRKFVTDVVVNNQYDDDPMLKHCGIFVEKKLTQFDGRVLTAPMIKVGNLEDCIPNNGRWNFINKKVLDPIRVEKWAIVNFSARFDMSYISRELIKCGRDKGIHIDGPFTLIEEDQQYIRATPVKRVEKMFEQIMHRLPGPPEFILCILAEKKNSYIYGPWKKKSLVEMGIVTQCISPKKITEQYLTNILLKINVKLGGSNSELAAEHACSMPLINAKPTMILGMGMFHSSQGHSDNPSMAAVVGSRYWPKISRYRASVRAQSPNSEMIDALYKPMENGGDDGIIRELLLDFYQTSGSRKPEQLIIFRDGLSESKFKEILNNELQHIIKVFERLDEPPPKFTVILTQRKHHTKLFQANHRENVPAGTIADTTVVHPRNYDFYMCPHGGLIGTSRPTHYTVFLDEIGFTVDDLQMLVYSLSYTCQRSTSAISNVAPIHYARLAALQTSHFVRFDDSSEMSSDRKNTTIAGISSSFIPEMPKLHPNVRSSMFFC